MSDPRYYIMKCGGCKKMVAKVTITEVWERHGKSKWVPLCDDCRTPDE